MKYQGMHGRISALGTDGQVELLPREMGYSPLLVLQTRIIDTAKISHFREIIFQ